MRAVVPLVVFLFFQPKLFNSTSQGALHNAKRALTHQMIVNGVTWELRATTAAAVQELCATVIFNMPPQFTEHDILLAIADDLSLWTVIQLVLLQITRRTSVAAPVRAGRQQELTAITLVVFQMAVLHQLATSIAALDTPPDALERVVVSTLVLSKNWTQPVVVINQLVPQLVQTSIKSLTRASNELQCHVLCAETRHSGHKRIWFSLFVCLVYFIVFAISRTTSFIASLSVHLCLLLPRKQLTKLRSSWTTCLDVGQE
jgi:hypothetical protein